MHLPIRDREFRAFCDKRHLKGLDESAYRDILKLLVTPLLEKGALTQFEMTDSTESANIQIVDWLAGALARFHNQNLDGKMFFEILTRTANIKGLELFPGY